MTDAELSKQLFDSPLAAAKALGTAQGKDLKDLKQEKGSASWGSEAADCLGLMMQVCSKASSQPDKRDVLPGDVRLIHGPGS